MDLCNCNTSILRCVPIIMCLVLVGCGQGYSKSLPNGYRLYVLPNVMSAIVDRNNYSVVGPSIGHLAVLQERWAVGTIVEWETNALSSMFVFDTKSGNVRYFSEQQEWNDELASLGLDEDPKLVKAGHFKRKLFF